MNFTFSSRGSEGSSASSRTLRLNSTQLKSRLKKKFVSLYFYNISLAFIFMQIQQTLNIGHFTDKIAIKINQKTFPSTGNRLQRILYIMDNYFRKSGVNFPESSIFHPL